MRHLTIKQYIENLNSESAVRGYNQGLKLFLQYLKHFRGISPRKFNVIEYLKRDEDDIEDDLIGFVKELTKANYSQSAKRQYYYGVKGYLGQHRFNPSKYVSDQIQKLFGPNNPINTEIQLNDDEWERLYDNLGSIGKVIFTVQNSTGFRLNELLESSEDNIVWDNEIEIDDPNTGDVKKVIVPKIKLPAALTKTERSRFGLLDPKSEKLLRHWMDNLRDDYLNTKTRHGKNFKKRRITYSGFDDRIFPLSSTTARDMLKTASKKAGLDKTLQQEESKIQKRLSKEKSIFTKKDQVRFQIHTHLFRKRFATCMLKTGDIHHVDKIMGHDSQAVNKTYRLTDYDVTKWFYENSDLLSFHPVDRISKGRINALEKKYEVRSKHQQDEYEKLKADVRTMTKNINNDSYNDHRDMLLGLSSKTPMQIEDEKLQRMKELEHYIDKKIEEDRNSILEKLKKEGKI